MSVYTYSAVVDREVLDMLSGALGLTVSFARRATQEDDLPRRRPLLT